MANSTRKSSGWSLRKVLTAVSAVDMTKKKKRKSSHLRPCLSLHAHRDHSNRCNSLHEGSMNYRRAFDSHCEGV